MSYFFWAKNELAKMAGLEWPVGEVESIHFPLDSDCQCVRCKRRRFMAQLKPLKFGYGINFTATATYTLAAYDVPRDVMLLISRVETTMTDFTAGTADFGLVSKVPSLSSGGVREEAYWQIGPYGSAANGTNVESITDPNAFSHLLLDTDEFLIIPSGYKAILAADLVAIGDGNSREIQTTVFGFLINPFVIEQIAGQVAIVNPGP